MRSVNFLIIFLLSVTAFSVVVTAQTKKNARDTEPQKNGTTSATAEPERAPAGNDAVYQYEFSQPDFVISRIIVKHNDSGKGTITFFKGDDEPLEDPISLGDATLERVRTVLRDMDFLNSVEDYQYEKDYSHLGTSSITLEQGGRKRTAKYNWTTNKLARQLVEEYRRISNLYIWKFDINLSRENLPLESPKLMERLDQMVSRDQVADTQGLIPFLNELSNDERLPLMARNRAIKIIKQIEKKAK
ncbi:MAG: hypothetical protein KF685_01875 [Acidobacteria bacterium]|nr:hypothetical protein [Acidobacteriota bacterium]